MSSAPDNDRVSPEEKKRNLNEAARGIISSGRLRIPPWNKDDVEALIEDPKVLPVYEDGEPCKGRKCLTCDGCDSFRDFISDLREVSNKPKDEIVENIEAANDALDKEFDNAGPDQEVPIYAGLNGNQIKFSRWELLKFAARAAQQTLQVDLIQLKRSAIKEDYNVFIPQHKWEVIRLFMILNGLHWWLDNIKVEYVESKEEFRILHVEHQDHYYLEGKMLLLKMDEDQKVEYLNPSAYIKTLDRRIQNLLKALQMNFNDEIKSLASWTMSYYR